MSKNFYTSEEYKKKQSVLTKRNWRRGFFNFLVKRKKRVCSREECRKSFEVAPHDPKIYCSSRCAATINNKNRILPEEVRKKISRSLLGTQSPFKGVIKVPRIKTKCQNLICGKSFVFERWKNRKFCSAQCAMEVIGGQPTSPRAARAKAGIRNDISNSIYFYSRWEANIARLLNLFHIKWIHQPQTFNLQTQKYTPDFYLPEYDLYLEVKNFLGSYSKERDEKFRRIYSDIHLVLLLKEEYLEPEVKYSKFIPEWEYKNSSFCA